MSFLAHSRRKNHGGHGGSSSDPYWSSVVLLLHSDGADASTTITDSSDSAHSPTAQGTAEIDTAQSVYGGASISMPVSTTGYISIPASSDFDMGTGDFTIEFRIRFSSTARAYVYGRTVNDGVIIITPSSGLIQIYDGGNILLTGSTAFNVDQWYSFALVRDVNDWEVFVDGSSYVTSTSASAFGAGAGAIYLSTSAGGAGDRFEGWMDEVRVTKGVARYTTAYTPATEAFPDSGASSGGAFVPSDATSASLVFWYEAGVDCEEATGDSCETDDGVQFWVDKSAAANDADQTTIADRPIYHGDGDTSDWSDDVVEFHDHFLDIVDLSAKTEGEFFVIMQLKADPSVSGPTGGAWEFGTAASSTYFPYFNGTIYDGWGSTTRKTVGNPTASLASPRVINIISAASDYEVIIDASSQYSTVTNTVGFGSIPTFGVSRGGATYLRAWVKGFCMYDGKLSTGDRSDVYDYFAALKP